MADTGSCSGCCSDTPKSCPKNFSEFIKCLKGLELRPDETQVDEVKKLMEAYVSNEEDFKQFVYWSKHKYTRHLVDDGNGKFNFLILCWGEGQGSPIHSHEGSSCMMKILKGSLRETRFQWPKEGQEEAMKPFQDKTFKRDDVTYINDKVGLHRVENPTHTEGAVSLHLYWPPFNECSVFDDNTGKEGRGKMHIWSVNGQLTKYGKENM